jgi:hypothetical protein
MPTPRPAKAKTSPATYVLIAFSLMFVALALGAVAWLYVIPHGSDAKSRWKCERIGDREICQGPSRLTLRR